MKITNHKLKSGIVLPDGKETFTDFSGKGNNYSFVTTDERFECVAVSLQNGRSKRNQHFEALNRIKSARNSDNLSLSERAQKNITELWG